jgi:2-C-methyl-D-erythritol 4-phosphate cytidylyltransferase/2-C-methyl-D-erythritol 2,4-cyclodiphosphate synthase
LCWSVEVFDRAGCSPIVAVVPAETLDRAADLLSGVESARVVAGGDSRQSSVRIGLDEIDSRMVVVHDAARPLVTVELIHAVLAALERSDGAVAAVPVDETIKRAERDYVIETLDRRDLYRAQTPQAFVTNVLREAHRRAADEGLTATDDAQLVERYGTKVVLVPGAPENVKLTYPEDFEVAERLAQRR